MAEKFVFTPTKIDQLKDNYDVIIIGSGGAGLISAIQAYELGLSPVILEKMDKLGGNTTRTSSGMNAAETLFNWIIRLWIVIKIFTMKPLSVVASKIILNY
jgi:Succinate dehydrogenase/fumarate reductase, flavoprotein subunit